MIRKRIYPDEIWIRDESPPPLVPSEFQPDIDEHMWNNKIEIDERMVEPRKMGWSWYPFPDEPMIEDESAPPLVPSEFHIEQIIELEEKVERLEERERKLLQENRRIKKINRFCFRIMLFLAGEVVGSFLSSTY